jgi:hypothetical protein
MVSISDWLSGFQNLQDVGILSQRSVEGVCRKGTGGRFLFAKVSIQFSPSDTLEFESSLSGEDKGQSESEGWLRAICLGVLDVMLVRPAIPITQFRCVINGIEFHPIDSSPQAFRLAARYATEEFLRSEQFVTL